MAPRFDSTCCQCTLVSRNTTQPAVVKLGDFFFVNLHLYRIPQDED